MNRVVSVVLLVVAVAGSSGWYYRETIKAWLNPPPSADHPDATPDVLYSWVDKDGVTHFSEKPGKGERLEFDGGRITPVDVVEAPVLPPPEPERDGVEASTGNVILDMRAEMERNAQIMSEAKAARSGL